MRLPRRQMMGLAWMPLAFRASAQRGRGTGGGACPDPDRPCPYAPPFPDSVRPLRRDLPGDRARNLKDLAQLDRMVQDLKNMVDKTDPAVVSATILTKSREIRKLAQKIEGRIRFDYGK